MVTSSTSMSAARDSKIIVLLSFPDGGGEGDDGDPALTSFGEPPSDPDLLVLGGETTAGVEPGENP